jgi:hypothetical protein
LSRDKGDAGTGLRVANSDDDQATCQANEILVNAFCRGPNAGLNIVSGGTSGRERQSFVTVMGAFASASPAADRSSSMSGRSTRPLPRPATRRTPPSLRVINGGLVQQASC